jgi:hypothetical protein
VNQQLEIVELRNRVEQLAQMVSLLAARGSTPTPELKNPAPTFPGGLRVGAHQYTGFSLAQPYSPAENTHYILPGAVIIGSPGELYNGNQVLAEYTYDGTGAIEKVDGVFPILCSTAQYVWVEVNIAGRTWRMISSSD